MTVAEAQEKDTPPNSRPSRNITVPPAMVSEPSQSMALRPATMGVVGVSMSRKKKSTMNASPSQGTNLFVSTCPLRGVAQNIRLILKGRISMY